MEGKTLVTLTEDEIRFCMRGIHELWANYGISQNEIKFLVKLENYIGMNETEEYCKAIGLPWLMEEENEEEESRP